ncbi:TlpA disulfide reductase family protein [Streptomyces sp. CB03911]|uniref:TlpA family protein disulfide reductase n=1 Tax=Streptomyces sp. CB03911 TaxID=1804758 RepID=UPI00093DBBC9|nr:TlpA disulfide reductase family protein [Streptomyces sp. CB03911]
MTAKGGKISTAARGRRQDAPDISGTTVAGGPAAVSDYRGKVVVLNIRGSWCDPCRTEAPGFQRAWEKHRDQGVQFLGLNTRDHDVANPRRFEQERGISHPSLFDPDGVNMLKFPKGSLNPQFIPTTLVIDREGRLAARGFGGQSPEDLESLLLPVLAEQP